MIQTALDTQHLRGKEIRPGWKHCPRMVLGKVRGTRLKLYDGRIGSDDSAPWLDAEILPHGGGSVIAGAYRKSGSTRVMSLIARVFSSLLAVGMLSILVMGKMTQPETISWWAIALVAVLLAGFVAVFWLIGRKMKEFREDDLAFLERFVEEALEKR